jgi:hypothetical protein
MGRFDCKKKDKFIYLSLRLLKQVWLYFNLPVEIEYIFQIVQLAYMCIKYSVIESGLNFQFS